MELRSLRAELSDAAPPSDPECPPRTSSRPRGWAAAAALACLALVASGAAWLPALRPASRSGESLRHAVGREEGCTNWQEIEITRAENVDAHEQCGELCSSTAGCAMYTFEKQSAAQPCHDRGTCILFREGCRSEWDYDGCWDLFPSPGDPCLAGAPPGPLYGQHFEDHILLKNFFCGLKGKTYLEIGGFDGVTYSNTKFYEDTMGWSGLLIEGAPTQAAKLQAARGGNAKNHIIEKAACAEAGTLTMAGDGLAMAGNLGEMSQAEKDEFGLENTGQVEVPCEPLSDMLNKTGTKKLALFVLDVEGAELMVLRTMDWAVQVCVWLVEMDGTNPEKDEGVTELLISHGYHRSRKAFWQDTGGYHGGGQNVAFVHADLTSCLQD